MEALFWIITSSLAMSLISFAGASTLFFRESILKRIILPLVAFSAGVLLGSAFLHILPEAIEVMGEDVKVWLWVLVGFSLFFLLEQFIHWHHCHKVPSEHKHPVTYLILLSDGLHNFIDGLIVAGAFIIDVRVGMITWLAIAAHEIPQEMGDFGVLLHGGWEKSKALLFNFYSSLTFLIAGLIVFFFSAEINISFLLPFAAGNFIYIASSDLIPEIKHNSNFGANVLHFIFFAIGIGLVLFLRMFAEV